MAIRVVSGDNASVIVGGTWQLVISVRDMNQCLVSDEPTVTVTLPDDFTATAEVEEIAVGTYSATYVTADAGRHFATITTLMDSVSAITFVGETTDNAEMPTADDLSEYLGTNSYTDEVLDAVLDSEAAAQRGACRVPAAYSSDLREALLRRCARNLAMRRVPLSVLQGDADAGTTSAYPGRDVEVRRLEGPYRRLPVG